MVWLAELLCCYSVFPLSTHGGTRRHGVTAFYAGLILTPHSVPHRAATARRFVPAWLRTLHKRQTVIVGCRGAGYLRACVALKPSGGAGLSKGQRGARRNAPIAPWETTPLVAVLFPTKLNGCRGFKLCQTNSHIKMLYLFQRYKRKRMYFPSLVLSLTRSQVQQPFCIVVQYATRCSFIARGLVRGLGGRFERAPLRPPTPPSPP